MTRRSVTNARYQKDNVGSTRKSASASKPKREAGEKSSSSKTKKPAEKRSFLSTLFGAGSQAAVTSPEIKKLRGYWWVLIGVALALAFVMVPMQNTAWGKQFATPVLALYALSMGGALYLEFGPIRKARAAAMLEAKSTKKSGKASKPSTKADMSVSPPAATGPEPSGPLAWLAGLFGGKKPGGDAS